jgi:single-stranded DNA-binding protein
MQVTLSGRTGREVKFSKIERHDGSGSFQVAETALAVKVNQDDTDWYSLKFTGDSLTKAANYIHKGGLVANVGELNFEYWTNEDGELRAKPVVTISEVQLPEKPKAA